MSLHFSCQTTADTNCVTGETSSYHQVVVCIHHSKMETARPPDIQTTAMIKQHFFTPLLPLMIKDISDKELQMSLAKGGGVKNKEQRHHMGEIVNITAAGYREFPFPFLFNFSCT